MHVQNAYIYICIYVLSHPCTCIMCICFIQSLSLSLSLSLSRLLGLTPVIQTICTKPTQLLIWDDTPVTYFINPWALIGMFWILGSDFQLWLSTKVTREMIFNF